MPIIKKYVLIQSFDSEDVETDVTALLEKGWELYGNPAVASSVPMDSCLSQECFMQAMIKTENIE